MLTFHHVLPPGWWCWADALVQVSTGESGAYPFRYNWPGIVATLALLLINALPRKDLAEAAESIEDGVEVRATWSPGACSAVGRGLQRLSVAMWHSHCEAAPCPHPPAPSAPLKQLRARLWLLFSFLTAFAAVGGSVAVLIQCTQQSQFVSVGVVRPVRSGACMTRGV